MQVKVVNRSQFPMPQYATEGSSGMDLYANLEAPIELGSLERKLIPTGLYLELPIGFEAQIRPRSGLALKKGLTVLNSPGTIDSDYRGEVGVIIINLSNTPVLIEPGERIAQMVVCKYIKISISPESGEEGLTTTRRGSGGFGSSGLK